MANELNDNAKIKAELEIRKVARAMREKNVETLIESGKHQVESGKVTDVFGSMVLDEFSLGEFRTVKDMTYWSMSQLTSELQKVAAPVDADNYAFIVESVWERAIDLVEKNHSERVKEKLESEVKPSYLQIAASAWKVAVGSAIDLGQESEAQAPAVSPNSRKKPILNAAGIALMCQELQHASKSYQSSGIEELFSHGIQQVEDGAIEDIFGHMARNLSEEEFPSLLEVMVEAIDNLDYLLGDKEEKILTEEGLLDSERGMLRTAWDNALALNGELSHDAFHWAEEYLQFAQKELFQKIWNHCETEQHNINKGRG